MSPCDSATAATSSSTQNVGQDKISTIDKLIDKVRSLRSKIAESNVSSEPKEAVPTLPSRLVKCARIVRTIEAGYVKCGLPLSLSAPGNIYYASIQNLFDELSAYANHEIENAEVTKLIMESYTCNEEYFCMPYSAFVYFLALRISRGRSDEFHFEKMRIDDWMISVGPLKRTWEAAVDLTVRKEVICTAIREDDEELLQQHLEAFQKAWLAFTEQLVQERHHNYHCYCPSISLKLYLETLPDYYKLAQRLEWLKRYEEKFPDDYQGIIHYIEQVPINKEMDQTSIKSYLYAQKTLKYCSNHLDLICGTWFREIKLCKDKLSEL